MRNVLFRNNKLNLLGNEVKVGDDFRFSTVTLNNLDSLDLAKTEGVRIFLTVPSVDTPVCDSEIKRFNEEIEKLDHAKVYAISVDLPFAQSKWCSLSGVESAVVASDYKAREFAMATGTLMDSIALLTRAAFVVDSNGKVVYVEYSANVSDHPNYEAILEAAKMAK